MFLLVSIAPMMLGQESELLDEAAIKLGEFATKFVEPFCNQSNSYVELLYFAGRAGNWFKSLG